MTKTAQALIWSVEGVECGRLWTFTVPREQSAKQTAAMWRRLAWELKRSLGFNGIRVFEMHPGGHGLHVHVVTGQFYDVRAVRSICQRMGWGRIHVAFVRRGRVRGRGSVARYLAKYLCKQQRRKDQSLKGVRLWAAFGGCSSHCKVKNVEVESTIGRIIRLLSGQDVIGFWGRQRCHSKKAFSYWRMRLAVLVWSGNASHLDCLLTMALLPDGERALDYPVHAVHTGVACA